MLADMETAADIIRSARRSAGLTQSDLARRLGTSQAAVAQLERPTSNPTVATLSRALNAAGHRLTLAADPFTANVDDTLLARQLKMTPSQRLASFEAGYEDVRRLALAGARARGDLA